MIKNSFLIFLFIILSFHYSEGSDTLKLSLYQADSMFIANNYYLLASSMNIEAQKAQIIQAGMYPNPIFTADINAYDPQNKTPFHVGNTGQKAFQFEQLLLLGGKRKAQIEMAKSNVKIAELEFQDLLRKLRFQLHSSLYALDEQAYLLSIYTNQLRLLDTILTAYDVQVKRGNIPLRDVVRLKGVYLNLNNERAGVYKDFFAELSKVQSLLQTDKVISPAISDVDVQATIHVPSLEELLVAAFSNRPDYLITVQDKTLAEQYYHFTKRMAVPDLMVFTSYDQRGGAFQNQINVGVGIPLPLWNRNRGNIKSAHYNLKEKEYNAEAVKNEIAAQVRSFYFLYMETIAEYNKTTQLYNEDFSVTLQGMSDNFKKGNVSLIEFVDFFEGYNYALAEVARIKIQLAVSAEQIKLSSGK